MIRHGQQGDEQHRRGRRTASWRSWPDDRGGAQPVPLRHRVDDGAEPAEIDETWPVSDVLPSGVRELWTAARSARLFTDVDYGQWGLDVQSPAAARDRTRDELGWRTDGVVDGDRWSGHSLVIRSSSSSIVTERS
jgi:hypothetical protein